MKRSTNGFTLLELLVVIAIISLLVSILLPSLKKARDLAKRVVCASNVRNIAVAQIMYTGENDAYLPGNASTSQGATDTDYLSLSCLYGPPILVVYDLLSPHILYSPEDSRKHDNYLTNWQQLPRSNPAPNYTVGYTYTFREPGDDPAVAPFSSTPVFQQVDSAGGSYFPPFRINSEELQAIISDRFTRNYVWSLHGGDEALSGGANYGNGDGWHVGFLDGHVTFEVNDPDIYCYGAIAAGGWSNRHHNWYYWDDQP